MKSFSLIFATVTILSCCCQQQVEGFSKPSLSLSIAANKHMNHYKEIVVLFSTATDIEKVSKSEEEWKQELPPEAYYVLRQAGTERPNSSELNDIKQPGTFICRGCGAPLFTTATKFDSGTGWPSFYQPIDRSSVDLKLDYKLLLPRTEVCCAKCDGHLGHVFEDGPEPTGQRYCMNGIAMEFKSDLENPDLAAAVIERENSTPFKPTVGSQLPGILLNGAIGAAFFASFVSRLEDIDTVGASSSLFDYVAIIPAVFYGVLAVRGVSRLV